MRTAEQQAYHERQAAYEQRKAAREKRANSPEAAARLRAKVMTQVDELGLVYGYIGNFERWGDDRHLYIEAPGLTVEGAFGSRKKVKVWDCRATDVTANDWRRALTAMENIKIGLQLAAVRG